MKLLGNIIWLIFGGLVTAIEYFTSGIVWCLTIVGIPFGLQCFKLGLHMLFPFGAKIVDGNSVPVLGCIGNLIWLIFFGWVIALTHFVFGLLLFITIIGIPFANKQFAFARLALAPFGKKIVHQ